MAAGIGSNFDVDSIVSQLMTLERRPIAALAKRSSSLQTKISALGSLKSVLSTLQTAATNLIPAIGKTPLQKFTTLNATVSDTSIASASATSAAVSGTYSLEVTQLAQAHSIATSTSATPFTGPGGTLVSGGTLTITLDTKSGEATPTKTTNVTIADGATPEAIRDAINAANAGVSATVVNGTLGKQLVLTGDTSGSDQFIKLSGVASLDYDSNTPPLASDAFGEMQTAQGSAFKLNGIAATASTNTVTTVIDGLTLKLTKQSAAGVTTALTLVKDNSSLTAGINAFVAAYNDYTTTAASLGSYNATTKIPGSLNGDSTLRSAQATMRALISSVPPEVAGSALQRLSDIGVAVQKDGTLKIDSTKLASAIAGNTAGVANLVTAYGNAFKWATDGVVGPTGTIFSRTEGLNASIKSLDKQSEAVSDRLTQIEARYRKQFTALDTLLSSMTTTSNFLTQQLANLPTYN